MRPGSYGYYLNSLRSLHTSLSSERRSIIARYRRLVKINHPCADAQARLIDINRQLIEVVEAAQRSGLTMATTDKPSSPDTNKHGPGGAGGAADYRPGPGNYEGGL